MYTLYSFQTFSSRSSVSVISAFYKLQDDLSDSGFFKRLLVRLVKPFFSRWHKKAAKHYPELETLAAQMMQVCNFSPLLLQVGSLVISPVFQL